VKIPSPIAKSRRRPKRSPSAAPVRSSTAKAQRVGVDGPLEVLDGRPPRSRRMLGSAIVTTRLSSVTMNSAIRGDHECPDRGCPCAHLTYLLSK
jgi:hypothetical protein